MERICLGTVGSGFIVRNILDHAQKEPGVRLTAVYSRSLQRGESLARDYGFARAYDDLDAFLADPEMNTVYIATPNTLHYPQAKKALLAGKHVILEKPFCTCAAHARELVELARQQGLMLVDATPTAYLPHMELLKQLLPQVGPVRLVMTNYSQYSSRYDQLLRGELPNNFNPAYGGGCLMDINYYNVELNVHLFGLPRRAVYYPNRHENGIDTSGVAVLEYPGFVSQNAGAKDTWGVNFIQIEGEGGYLYVSGGVSEMESVRLVTRQGSREFRQQEGPDRWYFEVREVTRLLLQESRDTIWQRQQTMLDVMQTLEQLRTGAGIRFPGEENG